MTLAFELSIVLFLTSNVPDNVAAPIVLFVSVSVNEAVYADRTDMSILFSTPASFKTNSSVEANPDVNSVTAVKSNSMSSAFAVIPVPPTTFRVASPVVAPPVIPAPATTEVMSPDAPDTVANDNTPEPLVCNTWLADPSVVGKVYVLPIVTVLPAAKLMLPVTVPPLVSNLSVLRLVKLVSISVKVSADPLPALVVIVAISYLLSLVLWSMNLNLSEKRLRRLHFLMLPVHRRTTGFLMLMRHTSRCVSLPLGSCSKPDRM